MFKKEKNGKTNIIKEGDYIGFSFNFSNNNINGNNTKNKN